MAVRSSKPHDLGQQFRTPVIPGNDVLFIRFVPANLNGNRLSGFILETLNVF